MLNKTLFKLAITGLTTLTIGLTNSYAQSYCTNEKDLDEKQFISFTKGETGNSGDINYSFWRKQCDDKTLLMFELSPQDGTQQLIKYAEIVQDNNKLAGEVSIDFDYLSLIGQSQAYDVGMFYDISAFNLNKAFTINFNCGEVCNVNGKKQASLNFAKLNGDTASKTISNVSGSWYDPNYSGSGFNLVETDAGLFVYFYGYKAESNGQTQWLLSDAGPKSITKEKTYTLNTRVGFPGNGGSFAQKPTTEASGTQSWGSMKVTFSSCNSGVIELDGIDGKITHNIIKLINVKGVSCVD